LGRKRKVYKGLPWALQVVGTRWFWQGSWAPFFDFLLKGLWREFLDLGTKGLGGFGNWDYIRETGGDFEGW